jgi:hypothetical protein
MTTLARSLAFSLCFIGLLGCSGDDLDTSGDPTSVVLGETTFVVSVNPIINDANDRTVPAPGPIRSAVAVAIDGGGPSVRSTAAGIAVLAPVVPGSRSLALSGDGIDGSLSESIADRDLVELAIAADGGTVRRMARVVYAFGGQVVELGADSSKAELDAALSASDQIVLLGGGEYLGDLEFSGSNVTLFGATSGGGRVYISGNVKVSGSGNRIRGATIIGNLDVSGSDFGMSFSHVDGEVMISGSDVTLLESVFCGPVDVSGSGLIALGNAGMAPINAPEICFFE